MGNSMAALFLCAVGAVLGAQFGMLSANPFVPVFRQGVCAMKLTILRHPIFWITTAALLVCWALPAQAVRIKDIATFSGVRDNQLIGYGLVVGLAGTGDKKDSVFTLSSMKNMMDRMEIGRAHV